MNKEKILKEIEKLEKEKKEINGKIKKARKEYNQIKENLNTENK